jgi:hypothetical protein
MDLRKHSRIAVETDCKAQFQMEGQTYSNIAVANLGAEGCCIRVPASAATTFKNRMLLEGMELIHPDLPKEAIKGRVIWLRTEKGANQDFVETGIQFSGASKDYGVKVDRYVNALLKSNPPTSM